ncbi:MAG TPA: hypothetical protein VJA94_07750 [Candidatus Angelobacter sp.]
MTNHQTILAQLSTDETLVQQLKQGNPAALEKLKVSFDELYASGAEDIEVLCAATCPPVQSGTGTDPFLPE